MSNLKENESGFTLLGVLMILAIFSVLGFSVLAMASSSIKLSDSERDNQSVFYIAEAGLTQKINKIEEYYNLSSKDRETSTINIGNERYDSFENYFGNEPYVDVEVENLSVEGLIKYKVISIGSIGNKHRTVEQEMTIISQLDSNDEKDGIINVPDNMAILTTENINSKGHEVVGNIGTKSTKQDSLKLTGNLRGDIYVLSGQNNIVPDLNLRNRYSNRIKGGAESFEFKLPKFPKFPESPNEATHPLFKGNLQGVINLDKNYFINRLIVTSKDTIIDVGNSDKELVLNELWVGNGGNLYITGTGKLKLYINQKFTINGGAKIENKSYQIVNNEKINRLEIYLKGTSFEMSNGGHIYGSIYADKAPISIQGSGTVFGNFFAGGSSFLIDNGGTLLTSIILAPDAHLTLRGNVEGTILTKSLVQDYGKVTYKKSIVNDGFFYLGNGNENTGSEEPSDKEKVSIIKSPVIEK